MKTFIINLERRQDRKKHIKNFTNYEYEYSIPNSEGEKIISTLNNTIKKERFFNND